MEYGVTLPVAGPLATAEALAAVATRAEALGFTSLWVTDHIAMPLSIQSPYPYTADRRAPWEPTVPYLDAFTALTWAAAVTRRVRLGTSVLVLPMRPPLAVAKTAGTLDYLSGGRVILGVGAGWLEEEFALLGQRFRDRGRRIVEAIRVLKASWAGDPVQFDGAFYRFAPFAMDPKPPQGAHLPILGGGESDAALRRVAAHGDGWHGFNHRPESAAAALGRLEEFLAAEGRGLDDIDVTVAAYLQPVAPSDLVAYQDAGVDQLVLTGFAVDPAGARDVIGSLGDQYVNAAHRL